MPAIKFHETANNLPQIIAGSVNFGNKLWHINLWNSSPKKRPQGSADANVLLKH